LTVDSAMALTVLVRRIAPDGSEEIGTGLLISRRLVLTALHVVCDFGPDLAVPKHDEVNIRLQFEISRDPDADESRIAEKRAIAPSIVTGRLIWPASGTPASDDRLDVALIALDNEGLVPTSKKLITIESMLEVDDVIERNNLTASLEKLRFSAPRADTLTVTFWGYTGTAQKLLAGAMRNAGLKDVAAIPSRGQLMDTKALITGHYLMGVDKLLGNVAGQPNPLGGGSGAAVWRYAVETDLLEVFGILQRAPPTDVAKDAVLVLPLPDHPEFKALVPAQLFECGVKNSVAESGIYPVAKARQVMHRLDRADPVKSYLDAFKLTRPKGYLFAFVSTQWDGSPFFLRRLQEESARPENPIFDRLICPKPGVSVLSIPGMTSRADLGRILDKLADALVAERPGSPKKEPTIAMRLASGAVSRLLLFDVLDSRIFDRVTFEARDGFRETLHLFLQHVADWSVPSVIPPGGETLERDNPLVAILNVVTSAPDFDEARSRAEKVIGKLTEVFSESSMVPSEVKCEVYPFVLDEIAFADFLQWCRDEVQMEEFADAVGRKMNPPFDSGTRNFNLISLGLDAVVERKWGDL